MNVEIGAETAYTWNVTWARYERNARGGTQRTRPTEPPYTYTGPATREGRCAVKKLFAVLTLAAFAPAPAGNVYVADYESYADLNVYVADYESYADLNVYVVDYESYAAGEDALWYFVDYESYADVVIYYVDYESYADLKVYFVDYESYAGWNKGHPWQERLH